MNIDNIRPSLRGWHISGHCESTGCTPALTGQRQSVSVLQSIDNSAVPEDKAAALSTPVLLTPDYFTAQNHDSNSYLSASFDHTNGKNVTMHQQRQTCCCNLELYKQELKVAQTLLADIIREKFTLADSCWLQQKIEKLKGASCRESPEKPFSAPEILVQPILKNDVQSQISNHAIAAHDTLEKSCSVSECLPTHVNPSLCHPETHDLLPRYDGSTDFIKFKAAFTQIANQFGWWEWEQIIWLKDVLLVGEINAAVFAGTIRYIHQVWNILAWEKLNHCSLNGDGRNSSKTKCTKQCKHCGGSHPSYVCLPCSHCTGFHYDNHCPQRRAYLNSGHQS